MSWTPELPDWLRDLLRDAATSELVDAVVEADIQAAFEHLREDADFVAALRASVVENVGTVHAVAMGEVRLDELDLVNPRRLAVVQAQRQVLQSSLQLSYRVGFLTVWRHWLDLVEGSDLDAELRTRASRLVTELVMAYQNAALAQVAREHMRTEATLQRSREHLRFRLVRDVVEAGYDPDPVDLLGLAYDVDADHVAVATSGNQDAAARWLGRARSACGVTDDLAHATQDGAHVRWLASTAWTPARRAALRAVLVEAGLEADVSAPARGLAGLRSTWGQLGEVRTIRAALGHAGVVEHGDVRLEAMFLGDLAGAAGFVEEELGALAGPGGGTEVLRETLRTWLGERSHAAAARALRLHENTVRNRVRRIEELLGHDLLDRPAELLLAIRLHALLDGLRRLGHPVAGGPQTLPPLASSSSRARWVARSV